MTTWVINMSEVPDFHLPFNFERLMCRSCTLVDTYYIFGPLQCKHCNHHEFADSTNFEDEWSIHHKNQRALDEAMQLVADLSTVVEKFHRGWYSTWNSYSTEQVNFDKPKLLDPIDYFSGEQ